MKIWVLNQNKGSIKLIDNAYVFEQNSINSGKTYGIKTYDHADKSITWTLGTYDTETRALEVLQRMFDFAESGHGYYEMPEK